MRTVTHVASGVAAAAVLRMGHRLKVGRIDASPVPAEMIKLEPLSDRPNEMLVRESVG